MSTNRQSSTNQGLLLNIVYSRARSMLILKYLLLSTLMALGLVRLNISIQVLQPPLVYRKDILQEYLLAKAVLAGIDPYLPIPLLAQRLLSEIPVPLLPNPTPHPPPVAVFSIPLAFFNFPQAASIWLVLELVCMVWIAYRITSWIGIKYAVVGTLILFFLFLAWTPFFEDLLYGQLMIMILALLIEVWMALNKNQHVRGGIFLGLAISLKLIVWPILLLLIIKKNWKFSLAALTTIFLAHLVATIAIGFEPVLNYYLKAGDGTYSLYKAHIFNYSTCSIGWRLFEGTGSKVLNEAVATPLINAPGLAPYVSAIIPLAVLLFGLLSAIKCQTISSFLGIMIILSILISPIAWIHYFTLAVIPVAGIIRLIWSKKRDNGYLFYLVFLIMILFIPNTTVFGFLAKFAISPVIEGENSLVPSHIALITMLPSVTLSTLIYILFRIDKNESIMVHSNT